MTFAMKGTFEIGLLLVRSAISLPCFFRTGITADIFRAGEITFVLSEGLTIAAMWGTITGRQLFKTVVGRLSSLQVVEV